MKTIFQLLKPQLLLLSALIAALISSCKTDELKYEDEPGIYIDKEKFIGIRDSATFSFAEKTSTLLLDTIYIPVKISGRASAKDRPVPLKTDPLLTTASAGIHYEIPETKIMANQITARVPVIVKRAADLKTKQLRIYLKMETNAEFPFLIGNTKTNSTFSGEPSSIYTSGYLIKLNDQLLKPDTWDVSGSWFRFFFGTYSAVKYKFIMDVTGRMVWGPGARFGADSPTSAQMYAYYAKLQNAMYEYEKANGPMIDETGNQVTFPKI
ncbi:DUF4843 domain-containing protein [Pedobacter caeni]|uniref:DUF4843 domain-containing protein n=1 Tax=Pedobacter caeni TaxID=288992 RepID=A0A1M4V6U8_9SPHI|nr:DUF4843 domain-containing protein [Pedobacter caeni]SHE64721.1 protein of unknown function [Pedobacter caeni]